MVYEGGSDLVRMQVQTMCDIHQELVQVSFFRKDIFSKCS